MNSSLPGINGNLFPSRFLADRLPSETAAHVSADLARRHQTRLIAWWKRVELTCGPATGVRLLFDLAAMPLFAVLGFRATSAAFERDVVRVRLTAPSGAAVGLLVTRWASRPSRGWRDAAALARDLDARWCFVLAPPFLSIVRARAGVVRESVDFSMPDVFDPRSIPVFLALSQGRTFDAPKPGAAAAIDQLLASALTFQDRVRADLQMGVVTALGALSDVARPDQAFDEALTIVYRVLFLLFAESRDLVPHRHPVYRGAYAVGTLCREAARPGAAPGLWEGLGAVSRLSRMGCRSDDLIVRPFNGRLFARQSAPTLERLRHGRPRRGATTRDAAMQKALIALATRHDRHGREEISYADLGVEQLGAVYERVLDLDPDALADLGTKPAPVERSGHSLRRKQSGTFYTPQALADFVVRRTLAPLVSGRSADEILDLRVVDPAMGSGAFLVAACRYLATAYEHALIEDGRSAEIDLDDAERIDIRRLIAERCLAGVDANPVAVQLARLSLWLATLAQGKPLGFLDHRLRVGNSLVGAAPDDLGRIPERRRSAGTPAFPLFADLDLEDSLAHIARPLRALTLTRDDTVDDVKMKERAWAGLAGDRSPLGQWRVAATLWCARWFWPDDAAPSPAELRAAIDGVLRNDSTLGAARLEAWISVARRLAAEWQFLHWPIEFADVFYDEAGRAKSRSGFDAVIGNPPWEMLRQDRGEAAPGLTAPGHRHSLVRFIRNSGLYSCCDRGHMNLYQPFLERALSIARPGGRVGLVLPWGLAVDDGAAALRARLLDDARTDTLVGLDNSAGLFPIHRGLRFAALVTSPGGTTREIRARFGVRTKDELDALSDGRETGGESESSYPIRLSPAAIRAIGGTTRRFPDLRRKDDLGLLERLARAFPRLGDSHSWAARFGRELNATEDRGCFGQHGLPVIEGKHVRPFGVDTHASAYRIARGEAMRRLPTRSFERARLAYRDVSGVGNRLSLIAAIVPADAVTTHTLFCLKTALALEQQQFLCGLLNSFVLNAIARMLMGGHLTTSLVEDLPVPAWTGGPAERRIARLARRLASRPAIHTNALLQAAVARLYQVDPHAFANLLEHFPLVPREERDRCLHAIAL